MEAEQLAMRLAESQVRRGKGVGGHVGGGAADRAIGGEPGRSGDWIWRPVHFLLMRKEWGDHLTNPLAEHLLPCPPACSLPLEQLWAARRLRIQHCRQLIH